MHVENADAFPWLDEGTDLFDVAFIDFPDPSNFSVGKLYTTTFYRRLLRGLRPTACSSCRARLRCSRARPTGASSKPCAPSGCSAWPYHVYVPSFGEWGFVLAGRGEWRVPERLPADLRFLDLAQMAAMFEFPQDMGAVASRGQPAQQPGAGPVLRARVEQGGPVTLSRREFLSAALVGLAPKTARRLPAGGFVFESQRVGHALRDRTLSSSREPLRASVVIVGGGIAGLSAAWWLERHGLHDFVVLEIEEEAGGNARSGRNEVSAYPWAAHYVPVPDERATFVRELFTELGVLGTPRAGTTGTCASRQRSGCSSTGAGRTASSRTSGRPRAIESSSHGSKTAWRAFAAVARSRSRPRAGRQAGDRRSRSMALSMRTWLDEQGLDSPWLRWLVDYACRDDYGALARDVSAWAGIHYFASRPSDEPGPLTWPEGIGWVASRLRSRLGDRVRTGQPVDARGAPRITVDGRRPRRPRGRRRR